MTLAWSARPETEIIFDPASYVDGVPFEALARLRRETPVVVLGHSLGEQGPPPAPDVAGRAMAVQQHQ